MQIIHFKKFSVSMSTGTSKVDKILKMPPDSISEGVIQNFPGSMPPDPLVLFFAHYECKYASYPIYYGGINSLRGNSITTLKYSYFCNITQHGYRHADNSYILSFLYLCLQEHQRSINY